MPGPLVAGATRTIVGLLNLKVKVDSAGGTTGKQGLDSLVAGFQKLAGWVGTLRERFVRLGVAAIFLDRLIWTLQRTWTTLTEALGATRVAQHAKEFENFSKLFGIGVERFQEFNLVAGYFGANIRDVVDALMQMQDGITAFQTGEKSAVRAMKGSGLRMKDLIGKDVLERFLVMADALNRLPDGQKADAISKMFGEEGGRQLGPLSVLGAKEVVRLLKEAADLGAVMSKEQVRRANEYAVKQNRLSMITTAIGNNFARIWMPALGKISDFLGEIGGRFSKFFNRNADTWAKRLSDGVERVLNTLRRGIDWFDTHVMPFEEFVTRLGHAFITLSVVLFALGNSAIFGQFVGLLKVFLAISLLLESWIVWMRGGNSVFGRLLGESAHMQTFVYLLTSLWQVFVMLVTEVGTLVSTFVQSNVGLAFMQTTLVVIINLVTGLVFAFRLLTSALLVVESVFDSIYATVELIFGMVAAIGDILTGSKPHWSGSFLGGALSGYVGAGQSLANAGLTVLGQGQKNYGGYADTNGLAPFLGPTGYGLLYGPTNPAPVTQHNTITINTSADPDQTALAIAKITESYRRTVSEGGQRSGARAP